VSLPRNLLVEYSRCPPLFCNGFPVDNLRFSHVYIGFKFTLHAANDNFKMKLSHTGQNCLSGIVILFKLEGRVFSHKFFKDVIEFFLISLGLWLHSHRNDRLVELHFFQQNRMIHRAECFAGSRFLQSNNPDNTSGTGSIDPLPFVGVHFQYSGKFFIYFPRRVISIGFDAHCPAVNSYIGQFAAF